MIGLVHESGIKAVVNPAGAFVESLTAADGTALLFARRDMPNGKNRGGIPVCAPVFGPGETVGLNQHGFARNVRWAIVEQTESQVKLTLDNPASQVKDLPPLYAGCGMDLTIELLENGLRETLEIRNIGIEPFAANPAFHPYFPVHAGESAEHAGVLIDSREYQLSSAELAATQKINSVSSQAQLVAPHGIWTVTGDNLPYFAVWSEDAANFVCVEPTAGGYLTDNPGEAVNPDETKLYSMTILFNQNLA